MEMLRAGFDGTMIALWLGHESPETTQIYLDADLELKKKMLEKPHPMTVSLEFTGLMISCWLSSMNCNAARIMPSQCTAARYGGTYKQALSLHPK
jgi:hypothetical protein